RYGCSGRRALELGIRREVPGDHDAIDVARHLLPLLFLILDVGCHLGIVARRRGDRYPPNGTPLTPTWRHMAHDGVVDAQHARHLVERPGVAREVQEVVAP